MDRNVAARICLCPGCPTFVDCAEQVAFCLSGTGSTSDCILAEHGCICNGCPVHVQQTFQGGYYCTQGAEDVQARH